MTDAVKILTDDERLEQIRDKQSYRAEWAYGDDIKFLLDQNTALREQLAQEQQERREEVDHWVNRYNELEQWRAQTATLLAQAQRSLKDAEDWNHDVEEREAAVCPEDVAFDDYIRSLQSQLAQVTQERDRAKEDLRILTQGRFIQS